MARKPWDELSPGYRARLERQGVTREQHATGAPLHKARGHRSRQHEQQAARERREVNAWVKEYAAIYGRDVDEVRDVIGGVSRLDLLRAIRYQERMQNLYHEGHLTEASALWQMRDQSLPDWMFYYHGYFS